jgi:hypothetical protein
MQHTNYTHIVRLGDDDVDTGEAGGKSTAIYRSNKGYPKSLIAVLSLLRLRASLNKGTLLRTSSCTSSSP